MSVCALRGGDSSKRRRAQDSLINVSHKLLSPLATGEEWPPVAPYHHRTWGVGCLAASARHSTAALRGRLSPQAATQPFPSQEYTGLPTNSDKKYSLCTERYVSM